MPPRRRRTPDLAYLKRLFILYTGMAAAFLLILVTGVLFYDTPMSIFSFIAGILFVPFVRNMKNDLANLQARLDDLFHRHAI
jgi:hypothetical protein